MSDQLFGRPLPLLGQPPARLALRPEAPPERPVTDEKSGETMRIRANSPDVFEGDVPKLGDVVEFVCVRANNRGWGLKLRVRGGSVGE